MAAPYKRTLALLLFTLGIWLGQRCRSWHAAGELLQSQLLDRPASIGVALPSVTGIHDWSDIPPVVQQYFLRTFSVQQQDNSGPWSPSSVSLRTLRIRSLRVHQKGQFRMKDGSSDWRSFTAQQTVRAFPARRVGFLWEAEMALFQGSYPGAIHIRDAWVNGTAYLQASLVGILSLASSTQDDDEDQRLLLRGEMIRWLAESFLVPTVLLPQAGLVEWRQPLHDQRGKGNAEESIDTKNMVRLSMKDPHIGGQERVELDITFADDNDTIIVEAQRPMRTKSGFEVRPWIGVLSRFEPAVTSTTAASATVRVPMHMEAGWKRSSNRKDDVFYYFVGENHDLSFDSEEVPLISSHHDEVTASSTF